MQKKRINPATPDAVVDDILKNDAGTSALDDEANGETQSAKENVQTVDDITTLMMLRNNKFLWRCPPVFVGVLLQEECFWRMPMKTRKRHDRK